MTRELPDFSAALRDWLWQCPLVHDEAAGLHMDYLGPDEEAFTLLSAPSTIRYRRNILGEEIPTAQQEAQFALAVRTPYGEDTDQNLDNLSRMTAVSNWIQARRPFPQVDGVKVLGIKSTVTAYPQQPGGGTARYQIPITLTYRFK